MGAGGINSWLLSGIVNLMGAGMSFANARAQILLSVPTEFQTDATTAINAAQAHITTLAGLAPGERGQNAANTIGYVVESPYQTYQHT